MRERGATVHVVRGVGATDGPPNPKGWCVGVCDEGTHTTRVVWWKGGRGVGVRVAWFVTVARGARRATFTHDIDIRLDTYDRGRRSARPTRTG